MSSPAPRPSSIRVCRAKTSFRDRLRAYSVLVDDRLVGRLAPGEAAVVAVSPGTHRVRIKVDWTGSPEVPVQVRPGELVSLVAESRSPFRAALDVFSRTGWVTLTVESDAGYAT